MGPSRLRAHILVFVCAVVLCCGWASGQSVHWKGRTALIPQRLLPLKRLPLFGADSSHGACVTVKAKQVTRPMEGDERMLMQVGVLPHALWLVARSQEGAGSLCCTVPGDPKCAHDRSIAVPTESNDALLLDVRIAWPNETAREQSAYMCVNSTDRFYAVLTTCDPDFNTIELDVAITAKSTYGMLPGELYGLLQYFRVMVCVLLALGAVWCALVLRHRHTLLHVHHWITVVLLLAIVEACFRLIDLSIFNITGAQSAHANVAFIIARSCKKAVSRALTLIVSMGYGIDRPSLGRVLRIIIGVAVIYAGMDALQQGLLQYEEWESHMFLELLCILVLSFLDACMFVWIFESILSTRARLRARQQHHKLQLFTTMAGVVAVAAALSIVMGALEFIAYSTTWIDEHWDVDWQLKAFWETLYIALLLANMYAYMEELAVQEDEDEEVGSGGESDDAAEPRRTQARAGSVDSDGVVVEMAEVRRQERAWSAGEQGENDPLRPPSPEVGFASREQDVFFEDSDNGSDGQ